MISFTFLVNTQTQKAYMDQDHLKEKNLWCFCLLPSSVIQDVVLVIYLSWSVSGSTIYEFGYCDASAFYHIWTCDASVFYHIWIWIMMLLYPDLFLGFYWAGEFVNSGLAFQPDNRPTYPVCNRNRPDTNRFGSRYSIWPSIGIGYWRVGSGRVGIRPDAQH